MNRVQNGLLVNLLSIKWAIKLDNILFFFKKKGCVTNTGTNRSSLFKVDQFELVIWLHPVPSRPDSGAHKHPAHMPLPSTNNQPPHTQNYPPMTSIISLVRQDERTVRWNTQANGWTATASNRVLAGCTEAGQTDSRTPTVISDSSLGLVWPVADSTCTHADRFLNVSSEPCWKILAFSQTGVTWLHLGQPAFSGSLTLFNLGSALWRM